MKKFNNLQDLFHHQLKDIYSAEKQLISALPTMEEKVSNNGLKNAFSEHLAETREHKERLEKIGLDLDLSLEEEACDAMQGLINEAKSFLEEESEVDVQDAGIIANAQRIEHYEISAYGTVVEYAKALKHEDIADILQQTLKEESHADELLNDLAIENVNRQAKNL